MGVRQEIIDSYSRKVEHKYKRILITFLSELNTDEPRDSHVRRLYKTAAVYSWPPVVCKPIHAAIDEAYGEFTDGRDKDDKEA